MPVELHVRKIVHTRSSKSTVSHIKTGWPDNIYFHIDTGAQSQKRSRVLWDVRLIKSESHVYLRKPNSKKFQRLEHVSKAILVLNTLNNAR